MLADDPAAAAICAQLGDLALAIHMAAAYLGERPLMPLADFLAELQAQALDHAVLRALDQSSPTAHLHHIAQTIELSYRLLGDEEQGSGIGVQESGEPAIDEPTDHPAQYLAAETQHAAPKLSTQNSALKTPSPVICSPWLLTARQPRRSRSRCCAVQ